MFKKILKWFAAFWAIIFLILGAIYISIALTKGTPMSDFAVFQNETRRPLVFAHRGGARLYPENTLYAFEKVFDLGVDVFELDVRSTSDGTLIVLHDPTVDRTTDGSGSVNQITFAELRKLDAGYRWSPDGGASFPFRGKNITIPTLQEIFAAYPKMKFNIEPKQQTPSIIQPLCRLIRENKLNDKIIVGSFNQTIIDEFRGECPEVATAASPSEASRFLAMYKSGLAESYTPAMQALQIPEYLAGVQIVTKEFVSAAHERNLKVHVWTVNESADMQRLLENGVDGIMTDYPDRLLNLTQPKR